MQETQASALASIQLPSTGKASYILNITCETRARTDRLHFLSFSELYFCLADYISVEVWIASNKYFPRCHLNTMKKFLKGKQKDEREYAS